MREYNYPPRIQVDLNSKKSRNSQSGYSPYRQGSRSYSNVSVGYDFTSKVKIIVFICSILTIIVILLRVNQEDVDKIDKNFIQIGNKVEKKLYLEERLEAVKQETIAAELLRISSNSKEVLVNEQISIINKKESRVYSWINEKGNKVYSNKKRAQ